MLQPYYIIYRPRGARRGEEVIVGLCAYLWTGWTGWTRWTCWTGWTGLNLSWLGPEQAGRDRRLGRLFQGYKVPLKGFLEVSHEIAALCAFLVWSGTNVIGP